MSSPDYPAQLAAKKAYICDLFKDIGIPEPELFPSPPEHYRMRAEFRIWHEDGRIAYAMFEPGQKAGSASLIRLTDFPPAAEAVNRLMPPLLEALQGSDMMRNRLYQCEFLATLSGEMLVSLIYHKKLDEAWRHEAQALQRRFGIFVIGRSRGQKCVLSQDFVTEKLSVGGKTFVYRQTEGSFSQPNARVCEKMLEWACGSAQGLGGDLLELYCGNGNFTLPLAGCFRRVLATEVSKASVRAAQWGIAANGAGNIAIARLCAQEFAEAYAGRREFRRLKEQGIELDDYDFSTVFVDPPRAGIDAETLKLLAGFDNIIYVSCNPLTLRDNLTVLKQTHDAVRFALFDQFPFTHHIESGVLLKRKAI